MKLLIHPLSVRWEISLTTKITVNVFMIIKYLDNKSKDLVQLHATLAATVMNADFVQYITINIFSLKEFSACSL